jgi:transcriptional regulator with XRE-family HTH domain
MIERGEKNITLENIEKLSKGLDVSMKLIFEKLNKIH